MVSQLKIKAGNISHLTDARYFAAYGIEWMGFNFRSKDQNKIDIETAKTIIDWIEGPQIIAEFDCLDVDYIFHICHQLQINKIQLPVAHFTNVVEDYEVFWKGNADQLNQLQTLPSKLIIDSADETQPIESILQKNNNTIISLSGSLEKNKYILNLPDLKAIEICGSNEQEVGMKAFDAINDLFDYLETTNQI